MGACLMCSCSVSSLALLLLLLLLLGRWLPWPLQACP